MYSARFFFLIIILLNICCHSYKSISNDDIFICNSSIGSLEVIYEVGKYHANKPLYIVIYNLQRQAVSEIDRSFLKKLGIENYLTEKEISNAVRMMRKYDFYLLAMDSLGDGYINPFRVNVHLHIFYV